MTADPICAKCGRTFAPDSRHVELEYEWVPPESRDDKGDTLYLCPEHSDALREWMGGLDVE